MQKCKKRQATGVCKCLLLCKCFYLTPVITVIENDFKKKLGVSAEVLERALQDNTSLVGFSSCLACFYKAAVSCLAAICVSCRSLNTCGWPSQIQEVTAFGHKILQQHMLAGGPRWIPATWIPATCQSSSVSSPTQYPAQERQLRAFSSTAESSVNLKETVTTQQALRHSEAKVTSSIQ